MFFTCAETVFSLTWRISAIRLLVAPSASRVSTSRSREVSRSVPSSAASRDGPPTGAGRERERQRWFRRAYRWRAGIEGRIGVLQRVYGLDRCPEHGEAGMRRWVGLGVLTANLVTIARATAVR